MPATIANDTVPMERRLYPRFFQRLQVHFHCLKSPKHFRLFESTTANVGAGGLAMLNEQPLEKGQLIMLTVFLPDPATGESSSQNDRAFFLSRVAWQSALPDTRYLHGVEFLDIAEEDRKRWNSFLGTCEKKI